MPGLKFPVCCQEKKECIEVCFQSYNCSILQYIVPDCTKQNALKVLKDTW